ncbi:hypothetical protein L2E82_35226 [Cichorium intybus]|uniref:Uncharacterized protein n=1 Tax=Cichorium intybus TaxID=13427 RepID=A0ACB9BNG2_CICIN|nr:hypothetical protein L2E82_35226 [Cichorium intybus]
MDFGVLLVEKVECRMIEAYEVTYSVVKSRFWCSSGREGGVSDDRGEEKLDEGDEIPGDTITAIEHG